MKITTFFNFLKIKSLQKSKFFKKSILIRKLKISYDQRLVNLICAFKFYINYFLSAKIEVKSFLVFLIIHYFKGVINHM